MFVEKTTEKNINSSRAGKGTQTRHDRLRSRLRLLDYATLLYLGIMAVLLIFFHQSVEYWPLYVLGHFIVITAVILFINFAEQRRSRLLTFIRDTYPFFLYILMFEEASRFVNILFPFWLESHLIHWDYALFGNHPTVWFQTIATPWLTEVMAFSYWSYYILLPFCGILLYLRKSRALFHSFIFNLSLTLYVCYFSYPFLAARGPHDTLAHLYSERAMAGFFDNMVHVIQHNAGVTGAAFPSSHVAAVWIALIYFFRFKKPLGWIFTPLILSLSVAVVYMGYHYAVDSIAGILLVFITYPLGRFLEKRFDAEGFEAKAQA